MVVVVELVGRVFLLIILVELDVVGDGDEGVQVVVVIQIVYVHLLVYEIF